MPDAAQRFRVIGNDDEFGFRLTGATDFRRLSRAAAVFASRDFGSFESILDWGCGCGRVARYATRKLAGQFTGCDIDAGNVAWCQDHLPGEYLHTGLRPPLPFDDARFDLVYGVSVFTHFREALQDAWLEELRRVIRPGGFLLATTHGRTAIDFAGLEPNDYVALMRRVVENGIMFSGENTQLDGAVDHDAQYVNVYHSKAYVRSHWKKWFDVVEIIPGYIFTHDLVVLRRRD
jgi:SAM-dependent methyltransferase